MYVKSFHKMRSKNFWPICIRMTPHFARETTWAIRRSLLRAETSFTISAPSSRHRSATAEWHGPVEDTVSGKVAALAGRCVSRETSATKGSEPTPHRFRPVEIFGFEDLERVAALSGPFVLVSGHPDSGRVTVVRDHLGSLKLYYYLEGTRYGNLDDVLREAGVLDA